MPRRGLRYGLLGMCLRIERCEIGVPGGGKMGAIALP
jgi:hypothetical protein